MGKYFGTDGFRGKAGVQLTTDHAYKIGRYIGYYLKTSAEGKKRARVLIGKDTRLSGDMLESAISAGIASSGADVFLLGVAPTPCVSYLTSHLNFDMGVIITASHNPYCDNGIKIISRSGEKADEDFTSLIEEYLDSADNKLPHVECAEIGRIIDYSSAIVLYTDMLKSIAKHRYDAIRVGMDAANGAAYETALTVFRDLGAEITPIACEPNGINSNDCCGSTHPELLSEIVRKYSLDLGFAFDGDADRCICVDRQGNLVDGDGIMYILARRLKRNGLLKNNTVVATVMSNGGLIESLNKEGISVELTSVGDRFVYEKLTEIGSSLGGEQSGHIIVKGMPVSGDGVLSAICILEEMLDTDKPLDRLLEGFTVYPQKSASVEVNDKDKIMSDPMLDTLKEEIKSALGENSRVIVRASGTEPVIRIMAEASSKELCSFAINKLIHFIKKSTQND